MMRDHENDAKRYICVSGGRRGGKSHELELLRQKIPFRVGQVVATVGMSHEGYVTEDITHEEITKHEKSGIVPKIG